MRKKTLDSNENMSIYCEASNYFCFVCFLTDAEKRRKKEKEKEKKGKERGRF